MTYIRFTLPHEARPQYGRADASGQITALTAAPWLPESTACGTISAAEVTLLAPCTPSKIVAIGKNYRAHAVEMAGITGDGSVPREPLLFFKPPSAAIGPNETIELPLPSRQVEYEGELAVIVGTACCCMDADAAAQAIFGYTLANDVTARDLQRRDSQWARAKGFDTFCPLGPAIATDLSPTAPLETWLNGERVQAASIDRMEVGPPALVAYISHIMTLWPGDVVLTGTPEGVGVLQAGDRVEVRMEGIGTLRNSVAERT